MTDTTQTYNCGGIPVALTLPAEAHHPPSYQWWVMLGFTREAYQIEVAP